MVAEKEPRRQTRQRQSVAEMQNIRDWRAGDQLSRYDFRLVSIAGRAVVYVISRFADRNGVQNIYSVHGKRCSCPDFQHRCSKAEGLECKHVRMVSLWLSDCTVPEFPEPGAVSAVLCTGCGHEKEGRTCAGCGSTGVTIPAISPEDAAHAAARDRYEREKAVLWE